MRREDVLRVAAERTAATGDDLSVYHTQEDPDDREFARQFAPDAHSPRQFTLR